MPVLAAPENAEPKPAADPIHFWCLYEEQDLPCTGHLNEATMNENHNTQSDSENLQPEAQADSPKKAGGRRTGWTGLLADEFLGPGGALTALLLKAANIRGHQLGEMARALGVTYGYIAQLRFGHRDTQHISRDFAMSVARYLSESFGKPVPPILVMLIAGRIRIEDWLPAGEVGNEQIRRGLERLASDPVVGGMMPKNVWNADPEVQQYLLSLYSEVSSDGAMGGNRLPGLLEELLNAAVVLDDVEQRLAEMAKAA